MAGKRRAPEPTLRDALEGNRGNNADVELLAMIVSVILTVALAFYLRELELVWTDVFSR